MKTLLLISWILFGCAGYLGYNYYQKNLTDQNLSSQAYDKLSKENSDLSTTIVSLVSLNDELSKEKKEIEESKVSVSVTPPNVSSPVATQGDSLPSFAFPAIITTLKGVTYTDCKLDKVLPDGISFFHSNGVAHIPFSDLDLSFAKEYNYNPTAAAQYLKDQEAKREQLSKPVIAPQAAPQINVIDNSTKISNLQKQISDLQAQADSLDKQDLDNFNASVHRVNGALEHTQSMSHNPQAAVDRAQILELQNEINQLQ